VAKNQNPMSDLV